MVLSIFYDGLTNSLLRNQMLLLCDNIAGTIVSLVAAETRRSFLRIDIRAQQTRVIYSAFSRSFESHNCSSMSYFGAS